jgi:hypothetical protein
VRGKAGRCLEPLRRLDSAVSFAGLIVDEPHVHVFERPFRPSGDGIENRSLRARELSATLAAEFAAKCAGGWPNEGYYAFGCLRPYFWGIKGRAGQVLSFKILT